MRFTFEDWLFTIFDKKDYENTGFKAALSFYGRLKIEEVYKKWQEKKSGELTPYLREKRAFIEKSQTFSQLLSAHFGEIHSTVIDKHSGNEVFKFTSS